MKKNLYIICGLALLATLFSACKKETQNPYEGEAAPAVSISSEASAFVNDQVNLVLELSHFIHKNVEVYFDVEGVDAEALDLPSPLVIQAGSVKKVVPVSIDEELAPLGDAYDVIIKIREAVGASIASVSTVNVSMTNKDLTTVGLSGVNFDAEGEGSVMINLGKKLATDLSVTLAVSDQTLNGFKPIGEEDLTFERTVTVPAGNRSFRVPVRFDISKALIGMNEAVFVIESCGANATVDEEAIAYLDFMSSLNLQLDTQIGFDYYEGWIWAYTRVLKDHPYFHMVIFPEDEGSVEDIEFLENKIQADATQVASGATPAFSVSTSAASYEYLYQPGLPMGTYVAVVYTMDENYSPGGARYNYKVIETGASKVDETWFMYYYYSGYDYYYHYIYNAAGTGYYLFYDTSNASLVDTEEKLTALVLDLEAQVQSGSKTLLTATGYGNWSYRSSLTSGATYYGFMFEFTADGKATGRYCKDEVTIP